MKSLQPFLILLLSVMALPLSAQNGWGLVPGSSYGDEGNSLHIAYRLPGRQLFIPGTGQQIAPQAFPIVLGYGRTLNDMHLVGAELGLVTQANTFLTDQDGNLIAATNSITPQIRGTYKFLPVGGEHLLEPYFGVGVAVGSTFTSMAGNRFISVNAEVQALGGLRIYVGGPMFIQFELPYTWLNVRRLTFPDGSSNFAMLFGPEFNTSQFWPLFGLGVKW